MKKRPKSYRRPNWIKIENEYVTGNTTYRELARKHKVHADTINTHSQKGEWIRKKKEHADKTLVKTEQKVATQQSNGIARHVRILEGLLGKIIEKINIGATEPKSFEGLVREARELIKQLGLYAGHPTERVAVTEESAERWKAFAVELKSLSGDLYLRFLSMVGHSADANGDGNEHAH